MEKLYYKEYYTLERNHWWFKARLHILEQILVAQKLVSNTTQPKVLNAGAATGATSVMLKKHAEVVSLEYDKDCAKFLAEEVLHEEVVNESLTELPFSENSFDLVCAFDVVEHIDDDYLALSEIHRVLHKDGFVYITVPAFQFLWSKHDVINHHFRRYTRKTLEDLLTKNGFEIQYSSYFNSILFLPIFLVRMLFKLLPNGGGKQSTGSDFEKFNSDGLSNTLLYKIFKSETSFLTKKRKFPFGVSAVIIGKKK